MGVTPSWLFPGSGLREVNPIGPNVDPSLPVENADSLLEYLFTHLQPLLYLSGVRLVVQGQMPPRSGEFRENALSCRLELAVSYGLQYNIQLYVRADGFDVSGQGGADSDALKDLIAEQSLN